jgi:pimeloyl-ACP methyl ester carboxylesterase
VRGHGETSVRWGDYSVVGVGADMLVLARALGNGPALLVGTSMAGGAAVWAAAEAPQEIAGIVLIDPFVRDADGPAWQTRLQHLLFGVLFARPWGPALWLRYYASLYPTAKPADFAAYQQQLGANLRQRGRFEALRQMLFASKAASDARLAKVQAPALVLMGSKDPDFKDPASEARVVAERLQGTHAAVQMIEGAGHYPHAEMPEKTAAEIVSFLQSIRRPQESAHGA